jgi:hypothetical protein
MMKYLAFFLVIALLAACEPAPAAPALPTVVPFPTMTPGRVVFGIIPTPVSVAAQPGAINPLAIGGNATTPAPDYAFCPPASEVALDRQPPIARDMNAAMVRFLNAGGLPIALEDALRTDWGVLAATGFVRNDLDLTGEGIPEILVSYLSPDGGGALMIAACDSGTVTQVYDALLGGEAPQILWTNDMTFDGAPELMFSSRACPDETDATCIYRTQLISWRANLGQFINLFGDPITSNRPPTIEDVDQDQVSEVIVRLDDDGNAETGPLRTGVVVYDWNGAGYARALTQFDAPQFRVQVVHLADAAWAAGEFDEAAALYEQVITNLDLRNWQNDDVPLLQTYGLYRLLLAYAFLEDDRLLEVYQVIQTQYPDPAAAPVYIQMAYAFWNALQVTNNLRSACVEVQTIITARPESVGLLNRYGSESPVYEARDLCPF